MTKAATARKNHIVQWLLLLLMLFAGVTWLAKSQLMLGFEQTIFRALHRVPESLDVIVINITHFGSTAALYSMAAVTFILGQKKLGWRLLFNGMGAYLLAWLLKELIMRPRPAGLWTEVLAREGGVVSYGYPSGHAAVVTAIAVTLWPYVAKQYRPWLVVMVLAVGITRIILGVHAPLDIVGGVLLGAMVPLLIRSDLKYLSVK